LTTEPFLFRGTRMLVHLSSDETGGAYALIEMHHPPGVGPALHVHPRGPESFLVLDGEYTFVRGAATVVAHPGQALTVPAGVPHRYVVGPAGGRVLVVTPPHLDRYFASVAARLATGPVPLEEEFAIAAEFGQDFLDREGHWAGR
jgi:quercetin dioxygenase-like cupin family protein